MPVTPGSEAAKSFEEFITRIKQAQIQSSQKAERVQLKTKQDQENESFASKVTGDNMLSEAEERLKKQNATDAAEAQAAKRRGPPAADIATPAGGGGGIKVGGGASTGGAGAGLAAKVFGPGGPQAGGPQPAQKEPGFGERKKTQDQTRDNPAVAPSSPRQAIFQSLFGGGGASQTKTRTVTTDLDPKIITGETTRLARLGPAALKKFISENHGDGVQAVVEGIPAAREEIKRNIELQKDETEQNLRKELVTAEGGTVPAEQLSMLAHLDAIGDAGGYNKLMDQLGIQDANAKTNRIKVATAEKEGEIKATELQQKKQDFNKAVGFDDRARKRTIRQKEHAKTTKVFEAFLPGDVTRLREELYKTGEITQGEEGDLFNKEYFVRTQDLISSASAGKITFNEAGEPVAWQSSDPAAWHAAQRRTFMSSGNFLILESPIGRDQPGQFARSIPGGPSADIQTKVRTITPDEMISMALMATSTSKDPRDLENREGARKWLVGTGLVKEAGEDLVPLHITNPSHDNALASQALTFFINTNADDPEYLEHNIGNLLSEEEAKDIANAEQGIADESSPQRGARTAQAFRAALSNLTSSIPEIRERLKERFASGTSGATPVGRAILAAGEGPSGFAAGFFADMAESLKSPTLQRDAQPTLTPETLKRSRAKEFAASPIAVVRANKQAQRAAIGDFFNREIVSGN